MSATIERSLYISITKTRFDLFDDIKLQLKNGEIVEGTISCLTYNRVVIDNDDSGESKTILVDDIDDYLN